MRKKSRPSLLNRTSFTCISHHNQCGIGTRWRKSASSFGTWSKIWTEGLSSHGSQLCICAQQNKALCLTRLSSVFLSIITQYLQSRPCPFVLSGSKGVGLILLWIGVPRSEQCRNWEYLFNRGQSSKHFLGPRIHECDFALLAHSCKDVRAGRIPRQVHVAIPLELCGVGNFACSHVPEPVTITRETLQDILQSACCPYMASK